MTRNNLIAIEFIDGFTLFLESESQNLRLSLKFEM
jgi:hypothetical protein